VLPSGCHPTLTGTLTTHGNGSAGSVSGPQLALQAPWSTSVGLTNVAAYLPGGFLLSKPTRHGLPKQTPQFKTGKPFLKCAPLALAMRKTLSLPAGQARRWRRVWRRHRHQHGRLGQAPRGSGDPEGWQDGWRGTGEAAGALPPEQNHRQIRIQTANPVFSGVSAFTTLSVMHHV